VVEPLVQDRGVAVCEEALELLARRRIGISGDPVARDSFEVGIER
jgi:hypothetical protein